MQKISGVKFILCYILFLITFGLKAQTWQVLTNSPTSLSFRHDDLFFINPDTGWVCNVDGFIYKTNDGGESWNTMVDNDSMSWRCIGFANGSKGWAGNLGTGNWSPTLDTYPLYETNNGGINWNRVETISGPLPPGICGIYVFSEEIIFALGRYHGPTTCFLKTTDGGATWTSTDMSLIAESLIDAYFVSPDTGIIVGAMLNEDGEHYNYQILRTTNGGADWTRVVRGNRDWQLCWKITFPSHDIGYVTVVNESVQDSTFVLKTIDGGLTWNEVLFDDADVYLEGIGFFNDTIGWAGGAGFDNGETMDGGATWSNFITFNSLNRFRKVNDTLAYASGKRIYKYSPDNISPISEEVVPEGFAFSECIPNPFSDITKLQYKIPYSGNVNLRIYDSGGRFIKTLVNGKQQSGTYTLELKLEYFYNTSFFCVLNFDKYSLTQKILMIK